MATIAKERNQSWFFWLFGVLAGVLSIGDNVTNILAIVALGGSVALGGTLDAAESASIIAGSIAFGAIADKLKLLKPAMVKVLIGLAAVMVLFAFVHDKLVLVLANMLFGFLMAAPSPLANTFVTRYFPVQEWTSKYGKLNVFSFAGALALLGLSVAGLIFLPRLLGEALAIRVLLFSGGVLALLAGLVLWFLVREAAPAKPLRPRLPNLHQLQVAAETAEAIKVAAPATVNDKLMIHYISTVLSFLGLGMAGSAMPYYLTQWLGAPAVVVPLVLLFYFLASALASGGLSQKISEVTPLRALSMGLAFRAACLMLIPIAGHFLAPIPAIVATGALVALTGAAGGVMAVASALRVATLAHPQKHGTAMGLASASINIGALMGALVGGLIGSLFPLPFVFVLGAIVAGMGCALLIRL